MLIRHLANKLIANLYEPMASIYHIPDLMNLNPELQVLWACEPQILRVRTLDPVGPVVPYQEANRW